MSQATEETQEQPQGAPSEETDHIEGVRDSEKALTRESETQNLSSRTRVIFDTTLGCFVVELFEEEAPITTRNFLKYVEDEFYDGTQFHRIIESFVIQGGGFTASMEQKATRADIKNEADNGLKNRRGTLSMARTKDPNSATSQFFINVVDNESLDHVPGVPTRYGYAVFGEVVDGMDVVDRIRRVKTTVKRGMQDVPVEPVLVRSVKRLLSPTIDSETTGSDSSPDPEE